MRNNLQLRMIFVASLLAAASCKQPTSNVGITSATPSARTTPIVTSTPSAPQTPSLPSEVKVVRNKMGMEFVFVPAGKFMMGSTDAEVQRAFEQEQRDYEGARLESFTPEKPQHQVTIPQGFYMGKYEVTQALWQKVMGNNPSSFKGCDQCPVEKMSWDDVHEFIGKLNALNDGYTYRLPSEAEWEYACRAGTTGDFAGDLDSMTWYLKNSDKKTHPVGQKQPNAWGLYDIYGNVAEWCEDFWHKNYDGAPTDGSVWLGGSGLENRVHRGGSWIDDAPELRAAYRGSWYSYLRDSPNIGFRLVAVART
jgi:formylglycine-generating enzyme required for sulfatase activity